MLKRAKTVLEECFPTEDVNVLYRHIKLLMEDLLGLNRGKARTPDSGWINIDLASATNSVSSPSRNS